MSILTQKVYANFDVDGNLPQLCLKLLSDQKKVWQDLQEGCQLLKNVKERQVCCAEFSVRLQHNPGRIKSSLADVSEKTTNKRSCFLCLNQLPEEQQGILYRSEYLILCNPMPVFPFHFTVSYLKHDSQSIVEPIKILLQLVADLGTGWTVLYNGPKCGASAPDHLHFQVARSGQMPIEKEISEENRLVSVKQMDGVSLYRTEGLGREVILMEGSNLTAVGDVFTRFLRALQDVLFLDEEPMVNIAGVYEERKWHLMIFPRRKHRPDVFFKEGDARVVVSPGVIDMGGLVITPVEKDFIRLDATAVEEIYREVSLDEMTVGKAINMMRP